MRTISAVAGALLAAMVGGCGDGAGNEGGGGAGTGGGAGVAEDHVFFTGASPSAFIDASYGGTAGGIVSCLRYQGATGATTLAIQAGPSSTSHGFYVDVTLIAPVAEGPFTLHDIWGSTAGVQGADLWFDEQHEYGWAYDCYTNQGSTCTTTVTELSASRLRGTIDCAGLKPEILSADHVGTCAEPAPSATAGVAFDCPLY